MKYDYQNLTDRFYKLSIKNLIFSKYQPLLFTKEKLYFNFDKWINGGNNILFIIGNSGSGKSFFSKSFISSLVTVLEFDDVLRWFICREDVIKKWTNEEFDIIFPFVQHLEEINYQYSKLNFKVDAVNNLIDPFIDYLVNLNYHKKIVLEGIWTAYSQKLSYVEPSVILLRTSFIHCWIKRSFRDKEGIFSNAYQKWRENISWKNVIELFVQEIDK